MYFVELDKEFVSILALTTLQLNINYEDDFNQKCFSKMIRSRSLFIFSNYPDLYNSISLHFSFIQSLKLPIQIIN